ncbi:MAG: alpha/beta hydrolase [Lactobacillales bacterium]|jgi:pimeloyl-ACP methyl ester carboxylesterase|nr:alpha/beta hydrolase [Lactobacillales bacterium]
MVSKKFIETEDGTIIYYEVSGTGDPLILLHGNGQSGRVFDPQVKEFKKYYTCIVIDSRAHGRSGNKKNELAFPQMARDVIEVMNKEKIYSANVLGFSDGANVAMFLATRYPKRVKKLILNAGNLTVNGLSFVARIASYFDFCLAKFFKKNTHIKNLLVRDIGLAKEDLRKITSPTLVLVGQFDVIKRSHSLTIAELIPKAEFKEVAWVGHLFLRVRPKQYNAIVLEFLRR